jgi:hypothetical protein
VVPSGREWRWVWLLLVAIGSIVSPKVASAAAMVTRLTDLRARAKTVVIGVVSSSSKGQEVTIERVLRGDPGTSKLVLSDSPDGFVHIDQRKRSVIFADEHGALRWVGELIAGPTLERGVLLLHGFFDLNRHIVSPGLMTLNELERYLTTGKLEQNFSITLAFPDGSGRYLPSATVLRVAHQPLVNNSVLQRPLNAVCSETARLSSLDWGRFDLSLLDACPARGSSSGRTLSFAGSFVGVDPSTGAIKVEAFPDDPYLYEAEFWRFVSRPKLRGVKRVLVVTLANGRAWKWVVDERLIDPQGRSYAAGGSFGSSIQRQHVQGKIVTRSVRRYEYGPMTLTLGFDGESQTRGGNTAVVMELVDAKRIKSCMLARDGQPAHSCTLGHTTPLLEWDR